MRAASPFPAFANPHDLLSACWADPAARNNVMMTIAWWMLVVGVEGSGMFGHADSFETGTWQLQLLGSKQWALCDPLQLAPGEAMGRPGEVDLMSPDHAKHPWFPRDLCVNVTAAEGDMLVYPSRWWHHTRCGAAWVEAGRRRLWVVRRSPTSLVAPLLPAGCRGRSRALATRGTAFRWAGPGAG